MVASEAEQDAWLKHTGLGRPSEGTGPYLVSYGEPPQDIKRDGDVINLALHRKEKQILL